MPKEKGSQNGIAREFWHLIPTNPPFGMIDEFGGRKGWPKEEDETDEQMETDDHYEEEVGIMEYHDHEGKFYAFAADMGVGMEYEGTGKLVNVNIDLLTYTNFVSFDHYEDLGGDTLSRLMEKMVERGDQLAVALDFRRNDLALANYDMQKDKNKILFHKEGINYSLVAPLKVKYGDFTINFGSIVIEDVLYFGLSVTDNTTPIDPEAEVLMFTKIINDLNFRTYWTSEAEDRARKITKRIFFLKD